MGNSQFRKPLIQSVAIVCGVILLFTLISSSQSGETGATILAFFSGLGNLLLLIIGLAIAIPFSIAILVAIFLGAVYLQSRENAARIYSDLKQNVLSILRPFTDRWLCCKSDSDMSISQEEYNQMEQEITRLKENNLILQTKIKELNTGNVTVNKNLAEVTAESAALKEQLDKLNQAVVKLQQSEKELNEILTTLRAKFEEIKDNELREQIVTLGLLHTKTNTNIDNIAGRLLTLEMTIKQSPPSGIFSYIKSEDDQKLFIEAVQEALSKEMTYSEIDEFLSNTLDSKLDKIVKDHPALTKNYLRNLKRD